MPTLDGDYINKGSGTSHSKKIFRNGTRFEFRPCLISSYLDFRRSGVREAHFPHTRRPLCKESSFPTIVIYFFGDPSKGNGPWISLRAFSHSKFSPVHFFRSKAARWIGLFIRRDVLTLWPITRSTRPRHGNKCIVVYIQFENVFLLFYFSVQKCEHFLKALLNIHASIWMRFF